MSTLRSTSQLTARKRQRAQKIVQALKRLVPQGKPALCFPTPWELLVAVMLSARCTDKFHIWAVRTVDEGIEILTGTPAGERQSDGTWEPGTVNARVDERRCAYAQRLKDFGRSVEFAEPHERVPAEIGPRAPRVRSWWAAMCRLWSWR